MNQEISAHIPDIEKKKSWSPNSLFSIRLNHRFKTQLFWNPNILNPNLLSFSMHYLIYIQTTT